MTRSRPSPDEVLAAGSVFVMLTGPSAARARRRPRHKIADAIAARGPPQPGRQP